MSTPREERHQNTRDRILDAALELIDRDGIAKFSLRAVARKVKYSPAGLYEYFDNKDDLVGTLCMRADDKLKGYLRRVPSELPYQDYMVELGMAYIRFARRETTHFRLAFLNSQSSRRSLEESPEGGAYRILLGAVQRGIDNGTFTERGGFGAEQITYTLWSMVHGMAMLQTSYLAGFDADFQSADRVALSKLISGLAG